jgi:UDP:flavonoid glycosyltransferase YjiC (YdhE family)
VSIPDILAALSTLDIEVVAALVPAQRKALDEVPANVRVVESVALHTVLPSCSAIVHHGGFGSYGAALVAGVPQLTVTTPIADHLLRAQRLVDEGAGLLFTHNGFTADDLRTSVARLVGEPGFRANAVRLRDLALAQPTPHELVADLEKLVAERSCMSH